jgi:DMSO/TMAO reductase YedYZ molybdopterin-dependent catalytic subunit
MKLKLTRGEAIKTIGSVAAGLPFIKTTLNDMDFSEKPTDDQVLKKATDELEYLTPSDKFIVQRRGNPVLSEIPEEKLASIGLTRDTWKLEISADSESNSEIGNPMTAGNGNAFIWNDLMKLAETKSVRYLHVLSCTNAKKLYGMGLWEGVPLKDILWKTEPKQNIRRIYYYGYHNDEPSQIFKSSIHISRVLEEAPGELPVMLCYKLNGKWISHANGGPVRLFVPGYYSNRSVKWLQKILYTNSFQANDTYAEGNNDVEGPLKTTAKFIKVPEKTKSGEPFAVTGLAQIGPSGLKKVQYWIRPVSKPLPENDPYFEGAGWKDAKILPPPEKWGSDLPDGKLPPVMQFDSKTGKPLSWPITNCIVHWTVLEKVPAAGEYEIRCRTIDSNGIAQPMPRPFGRSGMNIIETVKFIAE